MSIAKARFIITIKGLDDSARLGECTESASKTIRFHVLLIFSGLVPCLP
jgi:hypothetical protein